MLTMPFERYIYLVSKHSVSRHVFDKDIFALLKPSKKRTFPSLFGIYGLVPVINVFFYPYKFPLKWVTGVITPIRGVLTLLIAGDGAPCCTILYDLPLNLPRPTPNLCVFNLPANTPSARFQCADFFYY